MGPALSRDASRMGFSEGKEGAKDDQGPSRSSETSHVLFFVYRFNTFSEGNSHTHAYFIAKAIDRAMKNNCKDEVGVARTVRRKREKTVRVCVWLELNEDGETVEEGYFGDDEDGVGREIETVSNVSC